MSATLSSGDLARATGTTLRTIRFYEEERLLKPTVVSGGGHRRYTDDDLERLRLITDLREVGLSLGEIRGVLDLRAGCRTAAELAERLEEVLVSHVEQAHRRLDRLRRFKRELGDSIAALRERVRSELTDRCPCAVATQTTRILKVVVRGQACEHGPDAADGDPPEPGPER